MRREYWLIPAVLLLLALAAYASFGSSFLSKAGPEQKIAIVQGDTGNAIAIVSAETEAAVRRIVALEQNQRKLLSRIQALESRRSWLVPLAIALLAAALASTITAWLMRRKHDPETNFESFAENDPDPELVVPDSSTVGRNRKPDDFRNQENSKQWMQQYKDSLADSSEQPRARPPIPTEAPAAVVPPPIQVSQHYGQFPDPKRDAGLDLTELCQRYERLLSRDVSADQFDQEIRNIGFPVSSVIFDGELLKLDKYVGATDIKKLLAFQMVDANCVIIFPSRDYWSNFAMGSNDQYNTGNEIIALFHPQVDGTSELKIVQPAIAETPVFNGMITVKEKGILSGFVR